MKKRLISLAIVLTFCLTLLPVSAFAQDRAKETPVHDWTQFTAALNDPNCTTIKLEQDISSPQSHGDDAVFIGHADRDLTINGNGFQISLNAGGIILGGNTKIENLKLKFLNSVRNTIVANGYTLTLSNITNMQDIYPIHVFCGGITDYNGRNKDKLPSMGTHGKLIAENTCELGDIFAGSMSDGTEEATANANTFTGQATITLTESFAAASGSSIQKIFAHGGREPRDGSSPGGMIADASKYQVSGPAMIDFYGTKAKTIDGNTGVNQPTKASVTYRGNMNTNANPKLSNLHALTVASGSLDLPRGAVFSNDAPAVTVNAGARLKFDQSSSTTIGDFTGGGSISLGKAQHLEIKGNVSGQTKVAIDGFKDDTSAWGEPAKGTVLITAPKSQPSAFTLLPKSGSLSKLYLEWAQSGTWTVKTGTPPSPPDKTELTSFSIPGEKNVTKTQDEMNDCFFDVTCAFTPASPHDMFSTIPLQYTVRFNGQNQSVTTQSNTATVSAANMQIIHDGDSNTAEISITKENPDQPIPAGNYIIQIEAPLAGGTKATETINLQVTGGGVTPPPPPPPPAAHQHNWVISAQDATLHADCTGSGTCDLNNKAEVTLIAPTDLVYNGQGKAVTKQGDIPGIILGAVKYWKAGETVDKATEAAPVEPGTYTASLTHEGKAAVLEFTIEKKNAPTLNAIHLNEKFTKPEIIVAQIGAEMPQDAGTLTYTAGAPTPADKVKNAGSLTVTNGSMTVQLQNVQENDQITIPVTIASQYYKDSTQNIVLTMTSKDNQKPIEFNPPASMVYGTKISLNAAGGTLSNMIYEVQQGTGAATISGNELTATKAGGITVRARVAGDEHYNEVSSDWKKIVIEQALPTGQPHYTAITTDGKKLADAKLTTDNSTFNVKGKVAWAASVQTVVKANTAYEWIFTPEDSNYKELRGKLTPYQTRSDDSHSSDSSSKPSNQHTNPDGSVTTTVVDRKTGETTETTKDQNGTTIKLVIDKRGTVEDVRADISHKSMQLAAESKQPIRLPASVPSATSAAQAPEIAVHLAASGNVKVEIPVDHLSPSTVIMIVRKDGREEIVKKTGLTDKGVSMTLSGDTTLKVVEQNHDFYDVRPMDWYSRSVDFATSRGLMNGRGNGSFSPNDQLSRGMLAVILHNMESNPAAHKTGAFQDVNRNSWYADAVYWAVDEGILTGYNSTEVRPNDNITREQLAVILYRYMGSPQSSNEVRGFYDVNQVSSYAREAMSWAVDNGIVNGSNSGMLMPKGQASRAEATAMLMRFINLQ